MAQQQDSFEQGQRVGDAEKVNINRAGRDDLMRVYRIGDELADRIIHYREEHGPFKRPEDLLQVPGIGPDLVQQDAAGQISV